MRLGHAMFAGRISGIALFGDELSLAGDAALKLRLNVAATSLLERIGTTGRENRKGNREEERPGLHLLILGIQPRKANRQD